MTGELRESLAKLAKAHAEKAKVNVRKARQKGMTELKKKNSVSEDTVHRLEKYVCCGILWLSWEVIHS
jgi:ribosome recycling factor